MLRSRIRRYQTKHAEKLKYEVSKIFLSLTFGLDLELPCGHPGNIEHGLTDWNGTGPVARFACYQGYYLVGPPKIVCRYGRWFSDVPADRPTCKPVVCSHPK